MTVPNQIISGACDAMCEGDNYLKGGGKITDGSESITTNITLGSARTPVVLMKVKVAFIIMHVCVMPGCHDIQIHMHYEL